MGPELVFLAQHLCLNAGRPQPIRGHPLCTEGPRMTISLQRSPAGQESRRDDQLLDVDQRIRTLVTIRYIGIGNSDLIAG